MGCMGERVSDGGMIALICHGDMGLMFFFFFFHVCNGRNSLSCMAKVKWFVTGSLRVMVICYGG